MSLNNPGAKNWERMCWQKVSTILQAASTYRKCKNTSLSVLNSLNDISTPPSTIFTCTIAINFWEISLFLLLPLYSLFFTQWTVWSFKKHTISCYSFMSSPPKASHSTCNKNQAFHYSLPSPVWSGPCLTLSNLIFTTVSLVHYVPATLALLVSEQMNFFLPQGLHTFSSFCLFCSFP